MGNWFSTDTAATGDAPIKEDVKWQTMCEHKGTFAYLPATKEHPSFLLDSIGSAWMYWESGDAFGTGGAKSHKYAGEAVRTGVITRLHAVPYCDAVYYSFPSFVCRECVDPKDGEKPREYIIRDETGMSGFTGFHWAISSSVMERAGNISEAEKQDDEFVAETSNLTLDEKVEASTDALP
ncbi:Hypothetical protein POVN_LOCUS436 [uncultured virus]|nr:Hypothetical protein POVN_LOCUS436 [uncultured virus]